MMVEFSTLKGKYLSRVTRQKNDNQDELWFYCEDGSIYIMGHEQDCCETVEIEEIVGDLADLTGLVTEAEEVKGYIGPVPEYDESYTWTFYKIGTVNGFVTLRWLGWSNGYYSESVDFRQAKTPSRSAVNV